MRLFKLNKKYFLLFLLVFTTSSFCADWLITTSGTYILNDDLLSTNADSNGAIRIQSSFVTLDLNGRFIYQNNATASANGIVIDSGLTDVIVKNGTIINFTRCGLTVNSGCSVILLQDLIIENCAIRAMEILGTSISNVKKLVVDNCKMFGNSSSASSDYIFFITQTVEALISNCRVNRNNNSTNMATGFFVMINALSCTDCVFSNILVDDNNYTANVSTQIAAFNLDTSVNIIFDKCIVRNNNSPENNVFGFFSSSNTCKDLLFRNCYVLNNIAKAASSSACHGFELPGGKQMVFDKCIVAGLSSGSANGFEMFNYLAPITNLVFENCMALDLNGQGSAVGNRVAGIHFRGTPLNITIKNCFLSHQRVATPSTIVTAGLYIEGGTGAANLLVQNCDMFNNTNSLSDANSNGIRWDVGANNVFSQNIAARNGSTANANNIAGASFPAGSRDTSGSSTTMNSPTAPWTNLSIAS